MQVRDQSRHKALMTDASFFRFSTKCVRRELFCDGRINCAWPYVEPAGKFSNKERIRRARGLPQIKQIEFSGQKITTNNKSFYDLYFLLPQPPT